MHVERLEQRADIVEQVEPAVGQRAPVRHAAVHLRDSQAAERGDQREAKIARALLALSPLERLGPVHRRGEVVLVRREALGDAVGDGSLQDLTPMVRQLSDDGDTATHVGDRDEPGGDEGTHEAVGSEAPCGGVTEVRHRVGPDVDCQVVAFAVGDHSVLVALDELAHRRVCRAEAVRLLGGRTENPRPQERLPSGPR